MTTAPPEVVGVAPGPVTFCLVAGIAGHHPLWCYLDDAGRARTVGHVHGLPARIPDRPIVKGGPSLADLLRAAAGDPA